MKIVEHVSNDLINTKPKSLGYKSDYEIMYNIWSRDVTGMNINPVVLQYSNHVDKSVRVKGECKEGKDYF